MTRRNLLAVCCLLCVAAVIIPGCLTSPSGSPVTPAPVPTTQGGSQPSSAEASVVDANNRFALDAYARLRQDSGNLFFSPFSISSALAITYEGARGTTAEEIRSVFHFPQDDAARRNGFQKLIQDINRGNARYTLRTANALWAEKTYPFLPAYMQTAREYYGANATNLDFVSQPELSRVTINRWVEDQTEDRIRDLIPPGVIDQLTRLVITNAVYFKGTWVKQFDANMTKEAPFTVTPGTTVPVQMMQRTDRDATFDYAETGTVQVLRMPYASDGGKQLSMLVILPRGQDLSAVENGLTLRQLSAWRSALESRQVQVYIPKFTMETKYSLPETLSAMGMPTAFTTGADFSGMDGTQDLYIRDVIHQAFVDVNEEGTEAAAATAVVIVAKAVLNEPPIPVFRADHPFLFLIQDDDSGNILFIGRVVNPAA